MELDWSLVIAVGLFCLFLGSVISSMLRRIESPLPSLEKGDVVFAVRYRAGDEQARANAKRIIDELQRLHPQIVTTPVGPR